HGRRFAFEAIQPVCIKLRTKASKEVRAHQATQVLVSVYERTLTDDSLHSSIEGGNDQHMAARVARSPNTDPLDVHLRKSSRIRDGMPVIADLLPRVNFLPRMTITVAEVSIVEH